MHHARRDESREDLMPRSTRLTRRRFLALAAAAATIAPLPARAATPRKKKKTTPAAALPPEKLQKGIAEQKSVLALQLKTIRDYWLPPGSDPAFVFRPLRPRRLR
jgi:hypothetical protein